MAISPEPFQQNIVQQLLAAEEHLDRILTAAARNRETIASVVSIDYSPVHWQAFDALIPRYIAAGWKSVRRSTSGSSAYFEFEPNLQINSAAARVEEVTSTAPDRRKITLDN